MTDTTNGHATTERRGGPLDAFDLEQQHLGALMRAASKGRNFVYDVLPILKSPERFADGGHRAIFAAIVALAEKGNAPTPGRVIDTLSLRGELKQARPDRIGAAEPRAYIQSLLELSKITSDAELKLASEQLAQFWALREMVQTFVVGRSELSAGVVDLEQFATEHMTQMWQILDGGSQKQTAFTAGQASRLTRDAERLLEQADAATFYLKTGIHGVDAKLQKRVRAGNTVALFAQTKGGKSVAANKILREAALRDELKPLKISLEMNVVEEQQRIESAEAKVLYSLLDDPRRMTSEERGRLNATREKIENKPDCYHIVSAAGWTGKQILSTLRKYRMVHGTRLAIIDYVQLVLLDKGHSRERELGAFSAALKGIAEELGIILIICGQINAEMFKRASLGQTPRPWAMDARECKQVVMDASVSIVIDRPEAEEAFEYKTFHDGAPCQGLARWDLQKGRKIPGGWTTTQWAGEYQDFYNHVPGLDETRGAQGTSSHLAAERDAERQAAMASLPDDEDAF